MDKRPNLLTRLRHDQRGVIALTFAATFSVMLASSLVAIDFVRYNVAQTRIQNALDTAVISAGRKLANYKSSGPGYDPGQAWRDDAAAYFNANMPEKFLGVEIPDGALTIHYDEDRVGAGGQAADDGKFLAAQRISMTVSGDLPLMSTGFVQETSLAINAKNWALRRVRNDLELVLALDNTGSMDEYVSGKRGDKRMDVLKSSAKGLIDTVMSAAAAGGQTDGVSGAYIGIVPFTDSVNVGSIPSAAGWLDVRSEQKNYINNLWAGCIVEPGPASGGNWTTSNRLPATVLSPSAKFKPLLSVYSYNYTPSGLSGSSDKYKYGRLVAHDSYTGADYDRMGFLFAEPEPPNTKRDRRILATNNTTAFGIRPMVWNNDTRSFQINLAQESAYCTKSKTLFLSKDQRTLENSVDAMESYGGTGVPTGLIWAWRMLSPAWRGAAGWGSSELPRDPGSKLRKVIVLLSDGANEPVVRRGTLSSGTTTSTAAFSITYAYQECTRTTGSGTSKKCQTYSTATKKQTDSNVTVSWKGFSQCPITGLRTVDPEGITPDNYDSNCDASGTKTSTTIGYPRGSQETNRGNLTSSAEDSYMTDLCANIKADQNNILIYTLTLGSGVTADAKGVMRTCASDPDKTYFDVSNAADLPDVFAEIAGALTELRLTADPAESTGI